MNSFLLAAFVLLPTISLADAATAVASPSAVAPQPLPNVQLKFVIKRNELIVTRSEVQVELNHKATVIQQEAKNPYRYKIEVTPFLEPSSAIRLEFRISEVTDMDTTLLSTPSVIVFAGDSADVSQKKKYSDELKITVTPVLLN